MRVIVGDCNRSQNGRWRRAVSVWIVYQSESNQSTILSSVDDAISTTLPKHTSNASRISTASVALAPECAALATRSWNVLLRRLCSSTALRNSSSFIIPSAGRPYQLALIQSPMRRMVDSAS